MKYEWRCPQPEAKGAKKIAEENSKKLTGGVFVWVGAV